MAATEFLLGVGNNSEHEETRKKKSRVFFKMATTEIFLSKFVYKGKQNYMILRKKKKKIKMAATEFFFGLEITRNMKKREKKKSNLFFQNGRHGVPHAGHGLKINRR